MNKAILVISGAMVLCLCTLAVADLQNVEVGGQIQIRGNWLTKQEGVWQGYVSPTGNQPVKEINYRWRNVFLSGRPTGARATGWNVYSAFSWDNKGNDYAFVNQRTRLRVKADFTDNVNALIEIDSFSQWGEAFRSNYLTGVDSRDSNAAVALYQAYIEANEMFGVPLRLRVGRQELALGSQWLLGTNSSGMKFFGLSFDAVRVTYKTDLFSVDGIYGKLLETSPAEEDGDVDLYAVYGSYTGIENVAIDAYWMAVRDARNWTGDPWSQYKTQRDIHQKMSDVTPYGQPLDYDPTMLHTVGLRSGGKIGQFDYEAEVAYQFGEVDQIGYMFKPRNMWNVFVPILGPLVEPWNNYGDNKANADVWGANLEAGYTFDVKFQPRVFLGGAYFGGEDNRAISFGDAVNEIFNPYYQPRSSVSFNRLFSNWTYSQFLDLDKSMSNMWIVRGGVEFFPLEQVGMRLSASYYGALEAFDAPRHNGGAVTLWPWLTQENSKDLGWELNFNVTYNYSNDLNFEAGYAHLFVGPGLAQGNFNNNNGLGFDGGTSNKDANYVYAQTRLKF